MTTPLISALQKAKPIITKATLKIQMGDLTISLNKKKFVDSLLEEYTDLLRTEMEFDKKTSTTFDTDFAGTGALNEATFVVQDNGREEGEEQRFAFIGFYPQEESESEEAESVVPPKIEQDISWDELLAWCEYVFVTCGMLEEVLLIEANIQKELEEEDDETDIKEIEKITATVGDISVYPSSSVDYHAVRVTNEKDDMSILVDVNDLHEITYFIEHDRSSDQVVPSVYRDSVNESIVLSWGKKNFKMTFVDGEQTGTVKLSPKKAEQLSKQIEIIRENAHLF